MKMPWGKHKGKELTELPSSYLHWLSEHCSWNDEIATKADEEYRWREKFNEHWKYEEE